MLSTFQRCGPCHWTGRGASIGVCPVSPGVVMLLEHFVQAKQDAQHLGRRILEGNPENRGPEPPAYPTSDVLPRGSVQPSPALRCTAGQGGSQGWPLGSAPTTEWVAPAACPHPATSPARGRGPRKGQMARGWCLDSESAPCWPSGHPLPRGPSQLFRASGRRTRSSLGSAQSSSEKTGQRDPRNDQLLIGMLIY